jgi:hypothetical protein
LISPANFATAACASDIGNSAHMGKFKEVDRNSFLVEPGNELSSVRE